MKKALLVGINAYPNARLKGCINDIKDMRDFIIEYKGFKSEDIIMLTDSKATKNSILRNLNCLVNCHEGDTILFHFSGHGSQVTTIDNEADGLDEVICPIDFDYKNQGIRDNEFQEIFSKIPENVNFTWISDSCHSGDLEKSCERTNRLYPMSIYLDYTKCIKNRNFNELNGILISACKDNQTSADAHFEKYNGAFTYFFLKNAIAYKNKNVKEIIKLVKKQLKDKNFSQTPQLSGNDLINKKFLI